MDDETVDGWTLPMAVRNLLPETFQQILAAALLAAKISGDGRDLAHYTPIVWRFQQEQVVSGRVLVSGFEPSCVARKPISTDYIRHALPDFEANTLHLNGGCVSGLRFRLAALDADQLPAHSLAPEATYQTGAPGRPTSSNLYREKMSARQSQGELAASVSKEAQYLSAWLSRVHPSAPPAKPTTVANQIRDEFKALKSPPKR